jgi:hypothetical protein
MEYSPLSAFSRPSIAVLTTSILAWTVYLAGLAIYRLYLSPLAKFPGPRLAALTKWYEFYYDVVQQGQFTFQIQKMHKKYGTGRPSSPTAIYSDCCAKVPLSVSPHLNSTWRTAIIGMSSTPAPIDMINMSGCREDSAPIQ